MPAMLMVPPTRVRGAVRRHIPQVVEALAKAGPSPEATALLMLALRVAQPQKAVTAGWPLAAAAQMGAPSPAAPH